MTLSLKISDAAFTNYVSQLPPYISLAKAFYLFGTDEASSVRNYVDSSAPSSVAGTPSYGAGYATLTSVANGFKSGLAASGSPFTNFVVVSGNGESFAGNYNNAGGLPTAANELVTNAGVIKLALDGNYRVTGVAMSAGFNLLVSSHDGTTANIYQPNSGGLRKVSAAYTGGTVSAYEFQVGASGIAGTTPFNCAAAMSFGSVLSDAQIEEVYDYLKTVLATRSITVL